MEHFPLSIIITVVGNAGKDGIFDNGYCDSKYNSCIMQVGMPYWSFIKLTMDILKNAVDNNSQLFWVSYT